MCHGPCTHGVSDSRIPKCVRTSHYADDAFGLVPNGTRELLHGMVHAFFSANPCQNMLLIAAQGNMQIRGPAFIIEILTVWTVVLAMRDGAASWLGRHLRRGVATTMPYRHNTLLIFCIACAACGYPVLAAPPILPSKCQNDLNILSNMLSFFAINYIAHAATAPPVIGTLDPAIYVPKLKYWLSIPQLFAIIYPYRGLLRSLCIITGMSSLSPLKLDDTTIALLSGVVLLVARDPSDWEPSSQPELIRVRLPEELELSRITDSDAMNSHVYIEVEDAPFPTTRVDPKKHNIVGEIELPRGYRLRAVQADVSWFYFACQNTAIQSVLDLLMRLPIGDLPRSLVSNIQRRYRKITEDLLISQHHGDGPSRDHTPSPALYLKPLPVLERVRDFLRSSVDDTSKINLARARSVLPMVISIAQLISATIALYETRGDQITRFGYAAYGLSVIPYAIMTVVNLVCNACVGQWPCRFVLNTGVCAEAARRPDAKIDGVVGVTKKLEDANFQSPDDAGTPDEKGGYTLAFLSQECVQIDGGDPSKHELLVVKVGDTTRRFQLLKTLPKETSQNALSVGKTPHYTFSISSINNHPYQRPAEPSVEDGLGRLFKKIIGFCVPMSFAIILIPLPYLITYALTGFKAHGSTAAQRGWMMTWLVVGQCLAFVPPFQNSPALSKLRQADTKLGWFRIPAETMVGLVVLCVIVISGVPALGGFYEVGRMFLVDRGFHRC
ncbi:hypothetical protein IEO21_06450 [Rhodonia placenta]|uniref:Uncharacterized protein n=1 Tax=Rhodonia placenta TaxID=104341 RepID=A0A8H7U162_9APHY|nr:hypothetical protein IEO21_06450 [Postia placenta]